MEKHFLESYRVHDKPEAKAAAKRAERLTGDSSIEQDRSKRIEAYLSRLEKVFLHPDMEKRERNLNILKPAIYQYTLIKPENVPESYFEHQKEEARRRGGKDGFFQTASRRVFNE